MEKEVLCILSIKEIGDKFDMELIEILQIEDDKIYIRAKMKNESS